MGVADDQSCRALYAVTQPAGHRPASRTGSFCDGRGGEQGVVHVGEADQRLEHGLLAAPRPALLRQLQPHLSQGERGGFTLLFTSQERIIRCRCSSRYTCVQATMRSVHP